MNHEDFDLSDRLIAGVLSALAMGLTTIAVPLAVVVLSRGRAFGVSGLFAGFHIWAISVVVVAALFGICTGSKRSVELLAHLWGTAQPPRRGRTALLWCVIAAIGLASHWLAGAQSAA